MPVTLNTLGKADWTDYQDYWRDDDAEWLQERSILRYATTAARTTEWPSPAPGQVTYNQATDQLEHFSATAPTKWIGVLASQHLTVTPKTSAADSDPVSLGHKGAGGNGFQFFPTVSSENKIAMPNAYLDIGGGAIVAKPAGLTVTGTSTLATTVLKTGAKTVTLTTDVDSLVSDSKITAPAASIGNLTVTGTFSGGGASVVNANSGTIGGVVLSANQANASAGFVSQAAIFYGSATQARIRQRMTGSPFTLGTAGIDITDTVTTVLGTTLDISTLMRVFSGRPIDFYNGAPGTLLGHLGPVVYTATALVAANYPEGTIWVQP